MADTEVAGASVLDMSLDDRIAQSKSSRSGGRAGGAKRSDRGGARKARSGGQPYSKSLAPYKKGNSDDRWGHDLYGPSRGTAVGGELGARLSGADNGVVEEEKRGSRGRVDFSGVKGLLNRGLSVRGAGEKGRTVRVENLMEGTTAADVEAIFKDAGTISSSKLVKSKPTVTVELYYKSPSDAEEAVRKFDGQVADGLTIHVSVVAPAAGGKDLLARVGLAGAAARGRDLLDDGDFGGKMRSDELLDAPGAQIITGDAFSGGRRGRRRGGRS
ncbi:hypothetical protein CALCODRAFT_485002 [Calocera cornea HHB12733]|uniref:RRM domain-containing protein n=1 Tax=Calocera cornea HHB12733 TaxID=1353952 RepID=A0A165EMJ8_9BASI|nr:hypothetical protein CALCODRAFT_485002 [Calocera cornea HHB12733]